MGQDIAPSNMEALDSAIMDPRHKSPQQQGILKQEKARIQQLQEQMVQRQFTQRLEQRLNPRIGTPQDTDPQAAFVARLMLQMRKRYPGMKQGGPTPQTDY